MIKSEELSFIPGEQRDIYLKLINEGSLPAAHITENNGNWNMPEPDDRIIDAVSERVVESYLVKTK